MSHVRFSCAVESNERVLVSRAFPAGRSEAGDSQIASGIQWLFVIARVSCLIVVIGCPRMNDPGEKNDEQATVENTDALKMQKERSRKLALAAIQTAEDNGGRDLLVLDMREHTSLFDYFVIATGTSRRQLHAMSEEIDHKLEDDLHDKRMSIEGYDASRWIVLDYGTVVVHLFDDEMRDYYSLETLWADAQPVDLTDVLEDASKMARTMFDEA